MYLHQKLSKLREIQKDSSQELLGIAKIIPKKMSFSGELEEITSNINELCENELIRLEKEINKEYPDLIIVERTVKVLNGEFKVTFKLGDLEKIEKLIS